MEGREVGAGRGGKDSLDCAQRHLNLADCVLPVHTVF